MIHAVNAVNTAPTIQNDAMTERYFPLVFEGNISAPKENTTGTDPPIPNPPITLHTINQETLGTTAEHKPATAFKPSENNKQGFRPIISERYPQINPPTNIPMNTAELKSSLLVDEISPISVIINPMQLISTASAAFPIARHNANINGNPVFELLMQSSINDETFGCLVCNSEFPSSTNIIEQHNTSFLTLTLIVQEMQ
jgi:hypothetical protein